MPGIRWSERIRSTSSFSRVSTASMPDVRVEHPIAAMKLVAQAVEDVRLVVDDQECVSLLPHPDLLRRLDHSIRSDLIAAAEDA